MDKSTLKAINLKVMVIVVGAYLVYIMTKAGFIDFFLKILR
jgi:hypothetical protein